MKFGRNIQKTLYRFKLGAFFLRHSVYMSVATYTKSTE